MFSMFGVLVCLLLKIHIFFLLLYILWWLWSKISLISLWMALLLLWIHSNMMMIMAVVVWLVIYSGRVWWDNGNEYTAKSKIWVSCFFLFALSFSHFGVFSLFSCRCWWCCCRRCCCCRRRYLLCRIFFLFLFLNFD